MAVRYPEVPQVVYQAETHINHFCDQLINRINERRVELLTTVRDTRQEKDSRSAARARMEEELIALKSETLLKLQMNVLHDTQQQILEQLEAKLVEARTPVPETRIVFRGDAQNLEQLIRGVGEILEEEFKSNSEDNKCPFCKFPQPVMELDKHKATCQKKLYFENETEIGSVNSGPELVMSSRPIQVPHPRYQDREKNVPNLNPFLKGSGLTGTEQKMDLSKSRLQNPKNNSEKFPISRKQNPQPIKEVTTSLTFGASNQSFKPTTGRIPRQEPVTRKHQSPNPRTEPFDFYASSKGQNPKSEIHTFGASDQSFNPTTRHIPRQEPVSRKQSPKPKTEPLNLYGSSKGQNPKSETVYGNID